MIWYSCGNNLKRYLFADDAKMYCHIKDALDVDNLQRGINNFVKWTETWQVTLNINKCKVISVHHRRYTDSGLIPNYVINNIKLEEVEEFKGKERKGKEECLYIAPFRT